MCTVRGLELQGVVYRRVEVRLGMLLLLLLLVGWRCFFFDEGLAWGCWGGGVIGVVEITGENVVCMLAEEMDAYGMVDRISWTLALDMRR